MTSVNQAEGVFVGPVYTAKGMAGMLNHIRAGRVKPGSNIAFLHTGDTGNLFEIPQVVGKVTENRTPQPANCVARTRRGDRAG